MIPQVFVSLKLSFLQGIALTAIVTWCFLVPGALAAIDETMPNSIPKEILDDWRAQGGTADEIKASLPPEYAARCDGSFESACHWRRVYRMKQFPQMTKILFAKHHNIGSIAVGFWVNVGPRDVTDAAFAARGALCLLEFENYYSSYREILTKSDACVKDPCISLDGKKVCFAMSGNRSGTGYRLYEMEIDNPRSLKQLTFNPAGLTVADFEPCYLPNGDIMFSSTRCFGVIDCGWQPTSNMFVMDSTGKYIRQLGFDQVHTFYPVLCPNGTVLYTRWEYNDRDISNIMGLFSMNPDGSHQAEVFGNQTTWPQTLIHGRPVPGSPSKYFAVASGHHGNYSGEVCIIDNYAATNGPQYVKMISPPRETKSRDRDDFAFGGVCRNSAHPYPLDEEWYLVSYREENQINSLSMINNTGKFRIYLKNVDDNSRELLAWGDQSLHTPVLVAPWRDIWGSDPFRIAQQANYSDSMGYFTMQDVYFGAGMEGVPRGRAKTLRVVKLKYRVTGACDQGFAGQVLGSKPRDVIFSAPNICPVSLWGGSWDAKEVLGEAKIFEDGSAAFKVPARTPVYFQVLDSNGCSIAGMRSWSTLMPGETFSCYGCHENRKEAPPPAGVAMAGAPKPLDKPLGIEDQPFDYPRFVQPILDDHCVRCHGANHTSGFDLRGDLVYNADAKKSFTRSYTSLMKGIGSSRSNKAINITTIFSQPEQMPPYSYGSTQSGMIKKILEGHKNVNLTAKEIKILACWIDLEAPHAGTYDGYMSQSDAETYKRLEQNAQKWYDIEAQNINELAAMDIVAVMPHGHSSEKVLATAKRFSIGYLPTSRTLVLKNPCQGNLILVDLRGKVVSRFILSEMHTNGYVTVPLPVSLGAGFYIARLEGVNGIEQVNVTITK